MLTSGTDQAETIVARATPAGRGGIAVVRISGSRVKAIAPGLIASLPPPRHAALRDFLDADGEAMDRGIALYFPGPHSYTGEDILELHGHGGPVLCDLLIARALALGARLARPGEFTERAFLNDKLDLAQAEAVADLIDAGSTAGARAAQRSLRGDFSAAVHALTELVTQLRVHVEACIDFPDEDVDFLGQPELEARFAATDAALCQLESATRQGRVLRDGLHIVIAGAPNVGKSSLLNALAGYDAAIVAPVPGTTRDLVREELEMDGLAVHVVDTAGLRAAGDAIEEEGIRRTHQQLQVADHALVVVEAGAWQADDVGTFLAGLPAGLDYTIVVNKIDLGGIPAGLPAAGGNVIAVSALRGDGLPALRERLRDVAGLAPAGEGAFTARQRHVERIGVARRHFDAARGQLHAQAGELVAEELREVQNALAGITGEVTTEDLLGLIFGSFCIGK